MVFEEQGGVRSRNVLPDASERSRLGSELGRPRIGFLTFGHHIWCSDKSYKAERMDRSDGSVLTEMRSLVSAVPSLREIGDFMLLTDGSVRLPNWSSAAGYGMARFLKERIVGKPHRFGHDSFSLDGDDAEALLRACVAFMEGVASAAPETARVIGTVVDAQQVPDRYGLLESELSVLRRFEADCDPDLRSRVKVFELLVRSGMVCEAVEFCLALARYLDEGEVRVSWYPPNML